MIRSALIAVSFAFLLAACGGNDAAAPAADAAKDAAAPAAPAADAAKDAAAPANK